MINSIVTIDRKIVPTWATAAPEYWFINIGAFFDRFDVKALPITSSDDADVRGAITLILPRMYVDLRRPDLSAILDMFVGKGLITAGEKNAILNAPTTDYERYIKGLPQPTEG